MANRRSKTKKKNAAPSNPACRTGLPGDPSTWTPARTYKHLCKCFRRKPGELALTEEEFIAARTEYVGRALEAWSIRNIKTQGEPPSPADRMSGTYRRRNRDAAIDGLGKNWLTRMRVLLKMVSFAEFRWIILRGEGLALLGRHGKVGAGNQLRDRYPWLQGSGWTTLMDDLDTRPFDLACQEISLELGLSANTIPTILSPSGGRRAASRPLVIDLASLPFHARKALHDALARRSPPQDLSDDKPSNPDKPLI